MKYLGRHIPGNLKQCGRVVFFIIASRGIMNQRCFQATRVNYGIDRLEVELYLEGMFDFKNLMHNDVYTNIPTCFS